MTHNAAISLEHALADLQDFSPPLASALANREDIRRWFFERGGLESPLDRRAVAELIDLPDGACPDEATLQAALRRAKEAAFVKLALRDLWNLADLNEIVAGLSLLAESALKSAVECGLAFLLDKKGLPPWPDDRPLPFCVLGMGKLGAGELNYSSDVDLIYLYEPALWPHEKSLSAAEMAAGLGAFIGRALSQPTADGIVFRVDLDLRPAGKDGPMAATLDAARYHYLYRAAEWERLALIKMRPLAGNLELGREILEETRPFVFRRYLDYTALDELKELKARIARRPRSVTQKGFDLKLDKGGIRQLEFFVQTLQLIFAGRKPSLRRAATLDALAALAEADIITDKDRGELTKAYVFLRRAEHRLQLFGLRQTQVLPTAREGLDRLGRAMGYGGPTAGRDFSDDLARHTERVAAHFDSLLTGPPARQDSRPLAQVLTALEDGDEEHCLDLLAMAGFVEPKRALNSIRKLTDDAFLPHSMSRQKKLLAEVVPATLDRVLRSSDPDAALTRLEDLLARIGPKTGLYLLLLENPPVLDLLVRLLSTSAYLARVLVGHPGLLDGLIGQTAAGPKGLAELESELDELLAATDDDETKVDLIRRFKAEETLRIAVADLTGDLILERISDQLSDLAEVVLSRTLALASEILNRRYPDTSKRPPRFAVLALGKLGGRELAYHSDLDVLFLHQPRPGGLDGPEASEYAARLAQRIISLLSMPMAEGPGYELDARLRPSGRQGPLVVSLEAFAAYHQSSDVWERLALTKARFVAGDEDLGREAMAAVAEAVFDRPLPDGWAAELMALRRRMGKERGAAEGWDLKFGPGGLIDVEFAAEALQLAAGRNDRALRTPHTLKGLKAQHLAGLIDDETFGALYNGYRRLRRLDHRLRLIYDRSGDRVGYTDQEMVRAGADLGELADIRRRVAEAYAKVMEGL